MVATSRSTEVNIPSQLPSSTALQPTPATKHKRPYASGLAGALFASFCKQSDRQGALQCALQTNTELETCGWVGVYKRCSGSPAGYAVGGWWSIIRQGWNGTASLAQSGLFRSAPNVLTNLSLPRNPDKAAVRQRTPYPASQPKPRRTAAVRKDSGLLSAFLPL